MRFIVITKATADSEAGVLPATEDFDTMGNFIQEMVDAGVLLDAGGLQSQVRHIHRSANGDQQCVGVYRLCFSVLLQDGSLIALASFDARQVCVQMKMNAVAFKLPG